MYANQTRVMDAVDKCLNLAKELYGFDMPVKSIFRNTGRAGGKAQRRWNEYSVIFNTQLLADQTIEEVINEVVPHEIAHLVCFWNPSLGNNHDRGWQRVCIALGGSGKRTHDMPVKKARRTKKAIYQINGQEMQVGVTQHKRIQTRERRYRVAACGTAIEPSHFTGKIVLS